MHRKFIALIVGTAIAVTMFSTAPARAGDDAGRIIAGLAALALIGAAIHQYERNRDDQVTSSVRTYPTHPRTRPLPRHVARYDLPRSCLRRPYGNGRGSALVGERCLNQTYRHAGSLPAACRVSVRDGRHRRDGFDVGCLRARGYRLVAGR